MSNKEAHSSYHIHKEEKEEGRSTEMATVLQRYTKCGCRRGRVSKTVTFELWEKEDQNQVLRSSHMTYAIQLGHFDCTYFKIKDEAMFGMDGRGDGKRRRFRINALSASRQ